MNELRLDIDFITYNEYSNIERTNKYKAASIKKRYTDITALLYSSKKIKLTNCLHDVVIYWYRVNNRHDPDNIYFAVKFILDGIVNSGALPKDGRKNIRHIHHNIYESDTNFNYCIVKMKEVC